MLDLGAHVWDDETMSCLYMVVMALAMSNDTLGDNIDSIALKKSEL